MGQITVRRATEQDFAALDALYYATHEYHVAGVPERLRSLGPSAEWDLAEFHAALQRIFANANACLYVAEVDGCAAGMVEAYLKTSPDDPLLVPRVFVEIQNIFVQPLFRKQGVGRRLMAVAEDWASERGVGELCLSVWAFNVLAQHFYATLGFEPITHKLTKKIVTLQ